MVYNSANDSLYFIIKEQMIHQPSTNVKMTNVATIKYKINNKNFEIACYRNKALNWRNGVEEDLSEVLQMQQIYENASHGTLAKKADLNKFFPNKTKNDIIEVILERGELQITDKEREVQQANITADIINIIVEKCVHPATKRRFTHENIRQAIKDIHYAVKTDQPAKKQALECIKLLQKRYKIVRGDMRVRVSFDQEKEPILRAKLKEIGITQHISEDLKGSILARVFDIEPSKYRDLSQLAKSEANTTVEVLVNVVINTEHKNLEAEQSGALELLDELKGKGSEDEEEEKTDNIHKASNSKKMKKQMEKLSVKKSEKEEKVIKCSTCGETATFATAHEQRQHFKCDWHVDNVKRKSKNLPPLTEQEFKIENFNKHYE